VVKKDALLRSANIKKNIYLINQGYKQLILELTCLDIVPDIEGTPNLQFCEMDIAR
jgi:hypothetical protein